MSTKTKIENNHVLISRRKFFGAAVAIVGGGIIKIGLDKLQGDTLALGAGPGPSAFFQLNDVTDIQPKDADVWSYQASSKQWLNQTLPTLGGIVAKPTLAQIMQAQGVLADNSNDYIALTIQRSTASTGAFGVNNPFGADFALLNQDNQVGIIFGRNGFLNPYQVYQVFNDNTKTEDFSPVAINVLAGPQGAAFQTVGVTYDLFGTIFTPKSLIFGEDGSHPIGGTPVAEMYLANSGLIHLSEDGMGITGHQVGKGATVGTPGGVTATGNDWALGGHGHGFSGRFHLDGYLRNASISGSSFPKKFARFTLLSGQMYTMQRLSIFVQTAPTGGTEQYGIVNAAGTLQGTALTLAAGAVEATQTESAVLAGGLGGTTFYLAQTASNSNPASADANIDFEYTMAA